MVYVALRNGLTRQKPWELTVGLVMREHKHVSFHKTFLALLVPGTPKTYFPLFE